MCSLRLQEEEEEGGGVGGLVPPWGCLGPLLPAGYVCGGSTAAPSAVETQLASYVNYAREGSTHSGSGERYSFVGSWAHIISPHSQERCRAL